MMNAVDLERVKVAGISRTIIFILDRVLYFAFFERSVTIIVCKSLSKKNWIRFRWKEVCEHLQFRGLATCAFLLHGICKYKELL